MKKLILIISLLLIMFVVKSQSDCIMKFSYSGKINRMTISDSSKISILLPSTLILMKHEKKESFYNKIQLDSNENSFSKDFISHMSSVFCGSLELIINDVFKRDFKKYNIYVIYGRKKVKKQLKITDIKIEIINNKLNIILPEIIL